MSITRKRIKVLFYGNCYGAYRTQNLIKFCLDQGYRFFWISPETYFERGCSQNIITKLSRVFFSRYYLIELFIKACLSDVIYLLPVNVDLIKSALFVSKLLKKELICEMHASLYDIQVREKPGSPLASKEAEDLRKKDILALTKSDYVINPAKYEVEYWEKILDTKFNYSRLLVVPLFCEPTPPQKRSYARDGGIFEIAWWGTFHPFHGIDNLLKAIQLLKQKQVAFKCNLFGIPPVGQTHILDEYKQLITDLDVVDVVSLRHDLNFFDQSLPKYLAQNCDLALGVFGDMPRGQSAVPTKLVDALSMGLPTLTMNAPALQEFFRIEQDLWTCQTSPESISEAIYSIYLGTAPQVDWISTREKVLERFSLEYYHQVITEVFKTVESRVV